MNINYMLFYILIFISLSCTYNEHFQNREIVQLRTVFYNTDGTVSYTDIKKIWHNDSSTIEQVNTTGFITDTANNTTIKSSVLFFRFIDLKSRTFYDYNNFSDTAVAINKNILPDTMMKDFGWSYYSDKIRKIQGTPQELRDTIIDNVNYKRIQFNFLGDDPAKTYKIGYYRCDDKGRLFSLEKSYSDKIGCTMIRFDDFHYGNRSPFATLTIEIISDTLSKEEIKVIQAWENNIKKYPVKGRN